MKLEEKREIKSFLLPTHTQLERLHQLGFPTPSLQQSSSCPVPSIEQFASQQHLQVARSILLISNLAADLGLSVPLCQNHTGAVTCSAGVRAGRVTAEGSSAFTTSTD